MKQNKRELQGVGKVFQFTLVQFVKNKANKSEPSGLRKTR